MRKLIFGILTLAWLVEHRRACAACRRADTAERCYRRSVRPRHEPEVMRLRVGAVL